MQGIGNLALVGALLLTIVQVARLTQGKDLALLRLRMGVGRVGPTSHTLHLAARAAAGARPHAEGRVTLVAVKIDGMRPVPIPPDVVERLGRYGAG